MKCLLKRATRIAEHAGRRNYYLGGRDGPAMKVEEVILRAIKSAIVVPMFVGGKLFGELDIQSYFATPSSGGSSICGILRRDSREIHGSALQKRLTRFLSILSLTQKSPGRDRGPVEK